MSVMTQKDSFQLLDLTFEKLNSIRILIHEDLGENG